MATTTEKTLTPTELAITKAEAKPGLAVKAGSKFFIRNKKTGKTYRIEQADKKWQIVDNGTNKVLFSKDTKHHIRRIAKDWTPATEGTGPAAATGVAKTPATAKKPAAKPGNGDGKTVAGRGIVVNPEKSGGKKPSGAKGPFKGDAVFYKPAAASGKYPAKVLDPGPNKVQISVQFKKGDRPRVLRVPRSEITLAPKKQASGLVA